MSKHERYPLRQRWIDLAVYVGVQVEITESMPDFTYVGTGVIHVADHIDDDNLVHEVAHWIVATPRLRKDYEYGCGSSNEAMKRCTPTHAEYQAYEEQASLLGIAMQYAVGDHSWSRTYSEHNWDNTFDGGASPQETLRILRKRRLISARGIPFALLRHAKSRGEHKDLRSPLTAVFKVLK